MRRIKSLRLRIALFRERRILRELNNKHLEAYREAQAILTRDKAPSSEAEEKSSQTAQASVDQVLKVESLEAQIDEIRSARLALKLVRRGLDLPEKEWYRTIQAKMPWGSRQVSSLTKYGESKVRRRLRLDKRETWEFRFKVITPVLTSLIGLTGALIGLFNSERFVAALKNLLGYFR